MKRIVQKVVEHEVLTIDEFCATPVLEGDRACPQLEFSNGLRCFCTLYKQHLFSKEGKERIEVLRCQSCMGESNFVIVKANEDK